MKTPGRSCGRNQPRRFSKRLVVLAKRSASRALNRYFTQDTTLAKDMIEAILDRTAEAVGSTSVEPMLTKAR